MSATLTGSPELRKAKSTHDLGSYDRISYRQKGGELKGSLFRGGTSNAYNKQSVGSIPSKYETILHPENIFNKLGFGSNAFRFIDPISEVPGPGAYQRYGNQSGGEAPLQHSESHSKLGYGNGFISKNDRFRINNYHVFSVPGPGSYQPLPKPVAEKYKSQTHSRFFMQEKGKLRSKPQNPGPGQYVIGQGLIFDEVKESSAFKSESKRFLQQRMANNPSPAQYDVDMQAIKRQMQFGHNCSTANFKTPSACKRVKLNLYDLYENVEEEVAQPGPGSYPALQFNIETKVKVGLGRPSSMFAEPRVVDRFGRIVHPQSKTKGAFPGPAHYFKIGEDGKQKVNRLPAFNTTVHRNVFAQKKKVPGPAFYKGAEKIGRITINRNPDQAWM